MSTRSEKKAYTGRAAHTPAWAGAQAEALQALLARRGVKVARQALLEAQGDDRSPDAVADLLRRYGVCARVVRLGLRELRHLECPTLFCLEGGAAAVLERVHFRKAQFANLASPSERPAIVSFQEIA